MASCTIDGCSNQTHRRKMCAKHYARFRRHGDPNTVLPVGRYKNHTGWHVHCGDCGRKLAIVSTNKAIWQALDAHDC